MLLWVLCAFISFKIIPLAFFLFLTLSLTATQTGAGVARRRDERQKEAEGAASSFVFQEKPNLTQTWQFFQDTQKQTFYTS